MAFSDTSPHASGLVQRSMPPPPVLWGLPYRSAWLRNWLLFSAWLRENYFFSAWMRETRCIRDAWKPSIICVITWKTCFWSDFCVIAWKALFSSAWKRKINLRECVIGHPPWEGLSYRPFCWNLQNIFLTLEYQIKLYPKSNVDIRHFWVVELWFTLMIIFTPLPFHSHPTLPL